MKYRLVLLFHLMAICAVAQKYEVYNGDTINRVDSAGLRYGHWIIFGTNDRGYLPWQKYQEGEYIAGKKEGTWIEYYSTGKKKSEVGYKSNRANGKFLSWDESGHLSEEGYWKGNRFVGEYKLYYANDTVRMHIMMDSSGRRDGPTYYYYYSGKLQIATSYKAGKEVGWHREYSEDGTLLKEIFYNDGISDPTKTKEYPAKNQTSGPEPIPREPMPPACGSKDVVGTCKEGKLVEGKWYVYDANGALMFIRLYKNGRYVGDSPLPEEEKH